MTFVLRVGNQMNIEEVLLLKTVLRCQKVLVAYLSCSSVKRDGRNFLFHSLKYLED